MSKRRYRAIFVKDLDPAALVQSVGAGRVVVAVDVAKEDFFAAIVSEGRHVHEIVKWKHPVETRQFLSLIETLSRDRVVEVAMEPSGVYGDALRAAVERAGISVFRVSPKRAHDAAEVFDGVPSLHDAKAATIIATLHLEGVSEPWPLESDHQRRLTAALRVLEIHVKEIRRNRNRLEGYLARHWPGASEIMSLESATMLELLIAYGGPAGVAAAPDEARALMRRVGRGFLAQAKIDALVESAFDTLGVAQLDEERDLVREVASETRRHQQAANRARRRVEDLAMVEGSATEAMAPVVGKTTSAVLVAGIGEPRAYASATAYVKALGLNLKERSSGKTKGALHITKRGPAIARLFLYLAVLRLVQRDKVARAWYARKVKRDSGHKQKALIALMRKLAAGLWHVGRGDAFDSAKLFDAARLGVATSPT